MKTGNRAKKSPEPDARAALRSLGAASDEDLWVDLYAYYLGKMADGLKTSPRRRSKKPTILQALDNAYRERGSDPEIRELCEKIALQDISVFPHFIDLFIKEYGSCYLPPSVNYLLTLYHEKGSYEKAFETMDKVSSYWFGRASQARLKDYPPDTAQTVDDGRTAPLTAF